MNPDWQEWVNGLTEYELVQLIFVANMALEKFAPPQFSPSEPGLDNHFSDLPFNSDGFVS